MNVINNIHQNSTTVSYCFKFLIDADWPTSKNCAASICFFKFLAKIKGSTSTYIKQIAKDLIRIQYLSQDTLDERSLIKNEKDKNLQTVIRFLEESSSKKLLTAENEKEVEEYEEKNEIIQKIKYRFSIKNNYNYGYIQGDMPGGHFITLIKSYISSFIFNKYDKSSIKDEVKRFIYKNDKGIFCGFNSCLLCYDREEKFNFYAVCIVDNVFAEPENRNYHIFFNQSLRNQFRKNDINIFRQSGMRDVSYSSDTNNYQEEIKKVTNSNAVENFIHFDRFVTKPFNSIAGKKSKRHKKNKEKGAKKNILLLWFGSFVLLSEATGTMMAIVGLDKMDWNINFGFNGENLNPAYQSIFTVGFSIFCITLCITSIVVGAVIKEKKPFTSKVLVNMGAIGLTSISGSILGSIVKLPCWLSHNRQLFSSAESGAIYGAVAATLIVVIILLATSSKLRDCTSCFSQADEISLFHK